MAESTMYGIVEVNGHQYKVTPGMLLDIEKLDKAEGESLSLDKVLFVADDATTFHVGAPYLNGAAVKAKVIFHDKSKKVLSVKRNPGKYTKKFGHRQDYTCLLITEVVSSSGKKLAIDPASKNAQKYLK
jgi:large subunit ribosomal protein L21